MTVAVVNDTNVRLRSAPDVQPVRIRVGPTGVASDHLFIEAGPKDVPQEGIRILFKNDKNGDVTKAETMFIYQGGRR
mgnify:CR=1 FL=1